MPLNLPDRFGPPAPLDAGVDRRRQEQARSVNHSCVAFAGSQGNFGLNAMRPIVINNFLHSARILGDACSKLRQYCIEGTQLHRQQMDTYVDLP